MLNKKIIRNTTIFMDHLTDIASKILLRGAILDIGALCIWWALARYCCKHDIDF